MSKAKTPAEAAAEATGETPFEIVPHNSLSEALAAAQAEFGPLARDCQANVKSKKTGVEFSYRYSSLGNMFNVLRPSLNRHGLAIIHRTEYTEGGRLMLVGRLEWAAGDKADFRETRLFIDAPSSDPQAIGSYMTYARRYTFEALVGVAAIDDDDGQAAADAGGGKNQRGQRQNRKASGGKPPAQDPPAEKTPPAEGSDEWANEKFRIAQQKIVACAKGTELAECVGKLAASDTCQKHPKLLERILAFAMKTTEAKHQKGDWDAKTVDDMQDHLKGLVPSGADVGTQANLAF